MLLNPDTLTYLSLQDRLRPFYTPGSGVLDAPWITAGLLAAATAVAWIVCAVFFRFAGDTVMQRREALLGAVREG